jgi:hypothetical protein
MFWYLKCIVINIEYKMSFVRYSVCNLVEVTSECQEKKAANVLGSAATYVYIDTIDTYIPTFIDTYIDT